MSAQHACLLCRLPSLAAAVVALCMTAVGCANGKLDGDGPDDGSDGTTGDLTRGAGSSDSDAPVLLEATVRVEGEHCFLEASYDDPQGPNDVQRGTVWAVEPASGTVMWTDDLLVCVGYSCVGSFSTSHGEYASAPCSRLDSYELRAIVYDRSGLDSNTELVELL